MPMQIEVHDALEPPLEEGRRFSPATPTTTPYLSPGWARAWWRHLSSDAERPWIVSVRDVGAIAARRGQWDALVVNGLAADSPNRGGACRSRAPSTRARRSRAR